MDSEPEDCMQHIFEAYGSYMGVAECSSSETIDCCMMEYSCYVWGSMNNGDQYSGECEEMLASLGGDEENKDNWDEEHKDGDNWDEEHKDGDNWDEEQKDGGHDDYNPFEACEWIDSTTCMIANEPEDCMQHIFEAYNSNMGVAECTSSETIDCCMMEYSCSVWGTMDDGEPYQGECEEMLAGLAGSDHDEPRECQGE